MKTVILPGYSASNKQWVEEISQGLKFDHEIRPIFWEHWQDQTKRFSAEEKAAGLLKIVGTDQVNLIAKSVGTLVAFLLIEQIPDQINKAILCGVNAQPLQGKTKEKVQQAFSKIDPKKVIIFQNDQDPFGSFLEVQKTLKEINPKIKVKSFPASNHDYYYLEDFLEFLGS